MREYKLGTAGGLKISAIPLALGGSVGLWVVLVVIALVFLSLSPGMALLGSLLAVLLHWVSETTHQLGHALAARQTGYPMAGIRLGTFGLLSTSLYPPDEPNLPADVHIRRALGGPIASLLLSLVMAIAAVLLQDAGGMLWYVAVLLFIDNLFVLGLGAFLPLGFTDGSTLLYWWGKH